MWPGHSMTCVLSNLMWACSYFLGMCHLPVRFSGLYRADRPFLSGLPEHVPVHPSAPTAPAFQGLGGPKERKWPWVMPWGLRAMGGHMLPQTVQKEFFLSITSLLETVIGLRILFHISRQACPGHRSRKGRVRKLGLALSCPVTQPGNLRHQCSVLWSVGWEGCADEAACRGVLSDGTWQVPSGRGGTADCQGSADRNPWRSECSGWDVGVMPPRTRPSIGAYTAHRIPPPPSPPC